MQRHFSLFGWGPANWISISWFFPSDILHLISCFWPSNFIIQTNSFLYILQYYFWNHGFRYLNYLIHMLYWSYWTNRLIFEWNFWCNEVVFLWNRTLVAFVDKLSSTTVDFIRSEGELKNCTLYGLKEVVTEWETYIRTFDNILGWVTNWGGCKIGLIAICMIGLLPSNNFGCSGLSYGWGIGNLSIFFLCLLCLDLILV